MPNLTDVQVAGHLRKTLKETFPGVKFSVRSGQGGIDVAWENGPTREAVEAIARPMKGGCWNHYSGTYYRPGPLTIQTKDGEVTGDSTVSGFSYERTFSEEILERAKALWSEYRGMPADSPEARKLWHDWAHVEGQSLGPGNVASQVAGIASLLVAQEVAA